MSYRFCQQALMAFVHAVKGAQGNAAGSGVLLIDPIYFQLLSPRKHPEGLTY